jgi:diguanylate cyclase (GGDEF)-like protein/PAS domain S-box-containing protein
MDAEPVGQAEWSQREPAVEELSLAPSAILDRLPDAVVVTASDGRIVFVNRLAERLFGYPREELLGQPVELLWPERFRPAYRESLAHYLSDDSRIGFAAEAWGLRRDGSEFMGEMSWGTLQGSGGPLLVVVGRDISARRDAERRLEALATISQRALAGVEPVVLAADALELLRTALPISGAEVRLATGSVLASTGRLSEEVTEQSIGSGDGLVVAAEGEFTDEEWDLLHAVADILATALARLRGEERMRHDAVHDPLTGLANRTLLRDRLEQALARSRRKGGASGLLFVDLDNFKRVNDEYGHATGDAVLVELGGRLQNAVRPTDTVARLGGDEFVVVCEELDEDTALALGRRLHEALAGPLVIDGIEHRLSASIGIALGQADPDGLLGNADAAVYRAKAHGRGRVELFQ